MIVVLRDPLLDKDAVADDHERRVRAPRDFASALCGARKRTRNAAHYVVGKVRLEPFPSSINRDTGPLLSIHCQ